MEITGIRCLAADRRLRRGKDRGAALPEREFRAFVSVAEIGRMDHAAKEPGYSQPAISHQLECLQQMLGAEPGGHCSAS
ncbi:helix-turn-helix domain-containing protein [Kitasatospora sp. NPDC094028]